MGQKERQAPDELMRNSPLDPGRDVQEQQRIFGTFSARP
jgi:hypothetical protein